METEQHGPAVARKMVRIFKGARCHVQGHGHSHRAVVHRSIRRQEVRASQLHRASSQADSAQEDQTPKGEASGPVEETRLRRRGNAGAAEVRGGDLLIAAHESVVDCLLRLTARTPASRKLGVAFSIRVLSFSAVSPQAQPRTAAAQAPPAASFDAIRAEPAGGTFTFTFANRPIVLLPPPWPRGA